jgi:hypothetical protein
MSDVLKTIGVADLRRLVIQLDEFSEVHAGLPKGIWDKWETHAKYAEITALYQIAIKLEQIRELLSSRSGATPETPPQKSS